MDWDDYAQAHGEIDYGDVFLPIPPGNARAVRIHEETCARLGPTLGIGPGVRVYGPAATSGEGS